MDKPKTAKRAGSRSVLAVLMLLVSIFSLLFSGCTPHYKKEKEYRVDRIIVYGAEFENTGEVIWHDGLMVFDLAWVLESLGIELEWDNDVARFSVNGGEYMLDIGCQSLYPKDEDREQNNYLDNYLAPGAGYSFTGSVNDRFYVDTTTLTWALWELKIYSLVDTDRKNNLVEIYPNPEMLPEYKPA